MDELSNAIEKELSIPLDIYRIHNKNKQYFL
jgi:hypothetical protein